MKYHKPFRGQGNTCKGTLTITLTGPQGSGKSLVVKLLKALLPLMPVATVQINEQDNTRARRDYERAAGDNEA